MVHRDTCRLPRRTFAVFVCSLLGLLVAAPMALAQGHLYGVNSEYVQDWRPGLPFTDLIKQSRGFDNASFTGKVAVDSAGWPTADFQAICVIGSSDWGLGGTYKLSFNGQADVSTGSGSFTVQNKVYNSSTNTTTADIVVPTGADTIWPKFTNTRRTGSSATNTGLTNVKLIRPGYPADGSVTFSSEYKQALSKFQIFRTMNWVNTNKNVPTWPDRTEWAERKTPAYPTQTADNVTGDVEFTGASWEHAIQLCNETDTDIWVNVPMSASDDYVTKLATLLRDGNEFVGPLESNLKIYVEWSNEIWNGIFPQRDYQIAMANAMGMDQWDLIARRCVEFSNIFKTVFGSSAINTRVRVIYAGQIANWGTWDLNYINSTYGPPKNFIYGIAGAPYMNSNPVNLSGTVTQLLDQMRANSDGMGSGSRSTLVSTANNWQIKAICYEGGPDNGGGSTTNLANRIAANNDARIKDIMIRDLTTNWWDRGGDVFCHYKMFSRYDQHGMWGFSPTHTNLTHPKWQAVDAIVGTTPTQPPAAPTGLTATAGDAQVSLSWNTSSAATGYNVKRSTTSGSGYSTVGTSTDTSHTDTSLTNGTTYYYVVSATNSAGESGNSNQASATPQAAPPPTPDATIAGGTPTVDGTIDSVWSGATASTLGTTLSGTMTSSDLSATWKGLWDTSNLYLLAEVTDDAKRNDSTNVWDDDSVEMYVDGNNDKAASYDANDRQYVFGWNDTAATEAGGRNVTGVIFSKADPTSTSYRVEARVPWAAVGVTASSGKLIGIDVHVNDDDDGAGRDGKKSWKATVDDAWSNPSLFGTADLGSSAPPPPAAPTGLTAAAGNAQVTLDWNASTGATSYNVKRSTTSGSGYSTVGTSTDTHHVDSGLTNGTTYYYVVSAVNSVGESGNSGQASATPMGGQVAAPGFSPAAGTYTSSQSVTISSATSGASIRFTTDGSNPTSTTGTLYSGPVSISTTTTLKAIAYASGMTDSTVTSGTYTISTGSGNPSVSSGTITVDAAVDFAWSAATAQSISNVTGTISSTSDCSGTWKALWDSTNLYVLAEVTDDNKSNDSTDPWADDSVEVYLDGNNNKATSYDSNDRQYIFGWGDTTVREGGNRSSTGVSFAKADPTSTSYRIELKVPWGTLGVTASGGKNVGFDVHINDDDSGGAREGKRQWNDTTDNAWSNPSLFGTVTLAAPTGSPPAAPTGLTAAAGNAQVTLDWNASTGATSYNVKRSTTSGSGYGAVGTSTDTHHVDSGLTNGTTYYYVVSAVNSVGESANSGQASATPGGSTGGSWTLNPTADKSSQGDTSGTGTSPPASQWAHLHLKFSTAAVTGTVSNAKLRIYRVNNGSGSLTINCSQSSGNSDSWTEGGSVPGAGTLITSVANQNAAGYVEFDVTNFVNSQVSGDDVVTLVITTNSGTWTNFYSRESSSNKPQLVITSN